MKKLLCVMAVMAALLLLPALAAADDFSAQLSGSGGAQGFATIVTGSGQVAYNILTNGIGTPNRAYIAQGNAVFLELNASFTGESATGVVATGVDLSGLESNPGSYSVRVEGSGGTVQGVLAKAGEGDGGGGGGGGDECPTGYFADPIYPDFCFRVEITTPDGVVQPTRREAACIEDTVCVSGQVPGRSEVYLRILGPRPNGFLWPTIVRFTPSQVEVDILQLSSGDSQSYLLQQVPPGVDDLSGLQDREGFLPQQ